VDWNYRNNIARGVIIDRSETEQPSDVEYYVYGGDGMRLRKVQEKLISPGQVEVTEKIYLNGGEIKRVRRNGELILERITSHITDGTNRIALLHQWTRDRRGNETDDVSQKKIHYQLSNHLGSSSLEVDDAGNVISYEEYFPFGGAAFIAGNNRREVSLKDYRYSGKERDEATGFYYYGYRYYVPWTGRWLSPDPIGPEDGLNLYQFVRNNPVNLTDPNGLQSTEVIPVVPRSGTGQPYSSCWTSYVEGESGTQVSEHTFSSRREEAAFIREWIRQHPEGRVIYEGTEYDIENGTARIELEVQLAIAGFELEPLQLASPLPPASEILGDFEPSGTGVTPAGSGTPGGDGNGSPGRGAGSGGETTVGSGTPGGDGNGSPGRGAGSGGETPVGSGTPVGDGASGGVRGGRGVPGGRVGGTGTDPVEQRPPNPSSRVDGDPNGDPNGSLAGTVGPEEVHAEGAIGGNPNGSEQGTSGGTITTAQPQEELEWWQTALIVAAVIAVAIIATLLTGGAAALILGTSAASWSLGTLVTVGAISGAIAGFTGDLTSQALTLAFQGEENIWDNLDWGQAGQAAFVGAVTGAATAGLGSWLGGASRGASVAAGTADDVLPTTALYQFASRAVRGATIAAPTEALGETARQIVFDNNLDAGRILGAGIAGGVFGSAFEAGVPLVTSRLPTTGTQRLLAAIEANPDQGNLHQRVFAIRERLIERGLLSAEDQGRTTLALTEGFADTPQGLETRTLLHVTDPALYRNIEANRSVLPEGVQLGEINPVRSQGRVVLHAERQGVLEMMFLGLDQLGFTATTNLGCESCQTWMSMFAQQFAHLNPSIAPSGGGRATHAGVRSQFPLGVFFY
jgi:RHS repeat-associated protein